MLTKTNAKAPDAQLKDVQLQDSQSLMSRRGFMAFALAVCSAGAAVMLGGCSGIDESSAETAIKTGIKNDMAKLTVLDSQTAQEIFASDFTTQLVDAGVDPAQVYGPMFQSLTYTIDSVDVNAADQVADVTLTITNRDIAAGLENFSSALADYLYSESVSSSSQDAAGSQDASSGSEAASSSQQDEVSQRISDIGMLLRDAMLDSDLETVTTTVSVRYVLSDGSWVIEDNSELVKAILGGLDAQDFSDAALADSTSGEAGDSAAGSTGDAVAAAESGTDAAAGENAVDATAAGADAAGENAAA